MRFDAERATELAKPLVEIKENFFLPDLLTEIGFFLRRFERFACTFQGRFQLKFFIGKIRERRAELERQRSDIADTLHELADVEARCLEQLRKLEKRRPGR